MGSLFRRTERFYGDSFELHGALTALKNRLETCDDNKAPIYMGAYLLLNILISSEEIRDQSILLDRFDLALSNLQEIGDMDA